LIVIDMKNWFNFRVISI